MKVLLVSGVFPPERLPEANHAMHLATALAQHGVEVHVLTTVGALTEGFPFHVHAIMRGWGWAELPRLALFLRRCAPDAILMLYISFIYDQHPMAIFAPTYARALLPGVPFVTQFENVEGVPFFTGALDTRIVRRIVKQWARPATVDPQFGTLLRDSHRVIALGGRIEHALETSYPPVSSKMVLIPPPPLIPMATEAPEAARSAGRAALRIEPGIFTIVYFGYLYKDKGVETLLEAYRLVRQRHRAVHLVIVGGTCSHLYEERVAYVKGLKDLATNLEVQHEVTWTGTIEWDDVNASRFMYAADVCVLPFDHGVSMNNSTFAAAAAHGLPIITTQGQIVEPQFVDGENVLLTVPRDTEALAAAIESLLLDPDLRSRLSAGVAEMRREWFSWDRAVERTLATFA